jgi:uncharacterized phage infection (PIP) family protein YhgE
VASLLALFLGRAAWRSGVRLGARRMQRKVPGTVSELQTERDSMRAENAMLARKLEVRMGEMKAKLAEQAAEVSRHRNRIELLAAGLAQHEEIDSGRRTEITKLHELVAEFEGQINQRAETVESTIARLEAKDQEIARQADEIAALKSKIWKLQTRSQPIEERLAEVSEQSEKLAAEIRALDQAWPEKLAELGFSAQAPVPVPQQAPVMERPPEPVNGNDLPANQYSAEPAPPRQASSRIAGNVISLAQRIKALQKTITR